MNQRELIQKAIDEKLPIRLLADGGVLTPTHWRDKESGTFFVKEDTFFWVCNESGDKEFTWELAVVPFEPDYEQIVEGLLVTIKELNETLDANVSIINFYQNEVADLREQIGNLERICAK